MKTKAYTDACECERDWHFEEPAIGHEYGDADATRTIAGTFGTMRLCDECAENCHRVKVGP